MVGKAAKVVPEHMGATGVKEGVKLGFTTMVIVTAVAH